jgi:hypothetical protein
LSVLRRSLDTAKLGQTDKVDAFKKLDNLTRTIEQTAAPKANFNATIQREKKLSPSLDGRTAFDSDARPSARSLSRQLTLF